MISYYILLSYIFPREFSNFFEKTRGIFIFSKFFPQENLKIFLEIILKFSCKISPLKKWSLNHRKVLLNFFFCIKCLNRRLVGTATTFSPDFFKFGNKSEK